MIPVLFGLVPPDDRVTELVRREARTGFFAAPVDAPGWSYRSGESLDSLLSRVEGLEVVGKDGSRALARLDRPLLLQHRPRSWEGFGLLAPLLVELAEEIGGANRSIALTKLPPVLREKVRKEVGRYTSALDEPGMFVGTKVDCQVYIHPAGKSDQDYVGMTFAAPGKPFDPAKYADLFRRDDPHPVSADLRAALASAPSPKPGTRTLAEWVRPYPELLVDGRAKTWTVALAGKGDAATGLGAVARAARLYFRPFGEKWILAASPGEPRAHARHLFEAEAISGKYRLLAPLARAGAIPEDLFALVGMGASWEKAGKLGERRLAHIRNLLSSVKERTFMMTPLPNVTSKTIGPEEFAAFMRRHGGSDGTMLSVTFGGQIDVGRAGGSSFGVGVTFP